MIDDILSEQDGVITAPQAAACGLSREAVRRRVRSKRWEQPANGVYFVCDRRYTDDARIRIAVWGSGERAVLSGLAAAYWLGIEPCAPRILDVTVPRGGRSRALAGTTLRRRDLNPLDVVVRRTLRVTAVALTVLEAAVASSGGPRVMDRALQRHTTVAELRSAHGRNPGRHGATRSAQLLASAATGARSEAEREFVRLLQLHRITGWKANFRFGRFVIDFVFLLHKVAIEIDGWAYHSDASQFQSDRERQNILSQHWTILRFTWEDITERPDQVIARVRIALGCASGR